MQHWLNQHAQAISLVFHRLSAQRISTFVILLVIGVTLAIPSLIYVLTNNAQDLIGDLRKDSQMSLFLDQSIEQNQIDHITDVLKSHNSIKHHVFVSKEDALKELKEAPGSAEALSTLQDNPLPHAFFIEPTSVEPEEVTALIKELEGISGIDDVVLDSGWMKKLSSILDIGSQAIWIFGTLLCFAIITVISNTIRMQIVTHKEEIEVSQLFGATKSFIRRPFLYLGSAYGFGGGILASIILLVVVVIFNRSVSQIAAAYQSEFSISFNLIGLSILITIIATLVGWLAAYIAVSMHAKTE